MAGFGGRDQGKESGRAAGGKDQGGAPGNGGAKSRDGGTRAPVGANAPAKSPAAQSPSLGRQISDLFGGPTGYANNPNAPHYDTKTMGVPINMSWADVLNPPVNSPFDAYTKFAGMMASPIGYGMAATRAIQAATGMSGGPSIGGRDDGMGAFGGRGGTANGGIGGGALRPNEMGYQLPQGYMQQAPVTPTAPVTPPAQPTYNMLNQPGQFLSPTPGYGVNTPAYSYFGPMKR
jgi:hypothetical protein